ncbi:PP2C family serine/threonine-protein phosphatase [Catellatospora sp. NPDC049111]|uniref:PP2C family serine/threonine-protein phosphatase n=1 Tax=Catellatospora sp. NPDC049111 TaxID=3155271 RepID=UPI0033D926A5
MKDWRIVGASVRGTAHHHSGHPCQDASAWLLDPAMACLAVADGAGSRPHADLGATAAVQAVLRWARKGPPPDDDLAAWLSRAADEALAAVLAAAAAERRPAEDYACTLCVAVLTPSRLGLIQLGDGIAVVGDAVGFTTLSPPARTEYANETVFLTSPQASAQLRVDVLDLEPVDSVALSTDGLRFKILSDLGSHRPHVPFFEDAARLARDPAVGDTAVADFLSRVDDQSGDDKTLVIAVRTAAPPAGKEP